MLTSRDDLVIFYILKRKRPVAAGGFRVSNFAKRPLCFSKSRRGPRVRVGLFCEKPLVFSKSRGDPPRQLFLRKAPCCFRNHVQILRVVFFLQKALLKSHRGPPHHFWGKKPLVLSEITSMSLEPLHRRSERAYQS